MARPASGKEVLVKAKEALAKARTAEELRQAQAVILPLEFGFSMDQVAAVIGVSRGWACQLRTRYIRSGGAQAETKRQRGGRRRENMSKAEEAVFLAPFLGKAAEGGILVVGEIKRALEQRLGRKAALASVYNLLHRHNWRKLAPDKRHPQADVEAQVEWKKNSRDFSP
jgi:transposase